MTPTIAKFLDDVEAGVIPEDEVKHRTRLVRNELHVLASTLPKKVAEAVMVCVQWHDEQASAAQKLYQMHEQGIERTRNETGTPAPGYVDGLAREGQAIRLHRRAAAYFRRQLSRPAPAHPMAPTKDAHLNELLARAKACGPMTEEERAAQRESYVRAEMAMGDEGTCVVPPTPPADDSAVQRDIDSIFGMTDEEVIVDAGGPEAAEKIAEEGRAMLSRTLVMQRVVEAAREFQAARLRAKEVGRAPGWDGFRAMAAEWIDAERLESELFAALDALTDEAGT